MDRPKILIFSTDYLPHIGGAEMATKELAERLSGDFSFELICPKLEAGLASREQVGEVLVHRVGIGAGIDKLIVALFGFIKALTIKADLYWCVQASYASGAAYAANIVRFWNKTPIILTLQEGESEDHMASKHFGLIDISWRLALPLTHSLTAISNYLLERAVNFGYKGKTTLVPNGINYSYFSERDDVPTRAALRESLGFVRDDKVLVTSSRLVEKNAVDVIIDSLEYLPPHVKLLVIGDGLLRDTYKKSTRVKMLGSIENNELAKYLHISDIFVRPSRSEGLGISFLEAQAAGLPVVATKVGGIPDIVEHKVTGLFTKVDDPKDLAHNVSELLDDRELYAKLERNGREQAKSYDWSTLASKMKEVFNAELS